MTADLLALTFATPALLIGALAAAIPIVLHLLASVRAPREPFPTLRFLAAAMERTARRRRVRHWLLLILRSLVLGLLAVAVAEPISRTATLWGGDHAAVIILDTSASMATGGEGSRFDRARRTIGQLLGNEAKPSLAALLPTNGPAGEARLTTDLAELRSRLARTAVTGGQAPLAQRLRQARRLLADSTAGAKTIWIVSDLQQEAFEQLLDPGALKGLGGISVVIVDSSAGPADNVGITDLSIGQRRIVGSEVDIDVSVSNSSAQPQRARLWLSADGQSAGPEIVRHLGPADEATSAATVRFSYLPERSGIVTGAVVLPETDDLEIDDTRYFCLDIADHVNVLVVRGPSEAGAPTLLQPGMMLMTALDPNDDETAGPIAIRAVESRAFGPGDLADVDAAFFCQVRQFSESQALAIAAFVRAGGVAGLFLGPGTSADNYNQRFMAEIAAEGGLLPAEIGPAVGQVGPDAGVTPSEWLDTRHPYLAGLYGTPADYPTVLVQRYHTLTADMSARTLIQLAGGDPLIVAKPFGHGAVVLCGVPGTPQWSDLPLSHLFLPMVSRMALLSRGPIGRDLTYLSGTPVTIVPELPEGAALEGLVLQVTQPGAQDGHTTDLPLLDSADGPEAILEDTHQPGLYRWRVVGPAFRDRQPLQGAFAVNAVPAESDLRPMAPAELRNQLADLGLQDAVVAASLQDALGQLEAQGQRRNWWDVIAVVVILALVVEALVANVSRRGRRAGGAAEPRAS